MTKKQLEQRVDVIADLLGVPRTQEQAVADGKKEFLYIDYAQCYGGYMLVFVKVESGGQRNFYGMSRLSNSAFSEYLSGVIAGIELFKIEGVMR